MGVEEEIFEEFFNKLENNKEFPKAVLDELKNRYKKSNLDSKNKLLKVIRLGD